MNEKILKKNVSSAVTTEPLLINSPAFIRIFLCLERYRRRCIFMTQGQSQIVKSSLDWINNVYLELYKDKRTVTNEEVILECRKRIAKILKARHCKKIEMKKRHNAKKKYGEGNTPDDRGIRLVGNRLQSVHATTHPENSLTARHSK